MKAPILSIKSLTTGYIVHRQGRVVAEGLNASLSAGTFTALIGVNGAGKSTLLRTLAGLQPALSGQIDWLGKSLAQYDRADLSRTLSVVLTTRVDGEGLSVEEVVKMGRMPYTGFSGRLTEEDHKVVVQSMDMTGTLILRHRKMSYLSDGERQRVMIAKALAQHTPVILLDEPTAFLDFPSKVVLLRLLKKLATDHGKTIIISTHDLELTFQIAENLWLLSPEGLLEGSPQTLAANGILERFFHADGLSFDREYLRFSLI